MGDPRKPRKKYSTPTHPWNFARLNEERELVKEYGLKNKKEIWKAESFLRRIKYQAKSLISQETEKTKRQTDLLIKRLLKLNLIKKDTKVEDILDLTLKDILDRRLQSLVYKFNLTRSPDQARQFITHGHILIEDKKVTIPSYLVSIDEESKIQFSPSSSLFNADHPERVKKPQEVKLTKDKKEEIKDEAKEEKEKPKVVKKVKKTTKKTTKKKNEKTK